MSATLELAVDLIRRRSVTPDDAGCQALMMSRLAVLGFHTERLRFGEVENFWARHGNSGPLLCFAGHTDVVPTGPVAAWTYHPFAAEIKDGYLHGRGAADMKGSLAAMITATERFITRYPSHRGSLAYLITSDEEGPATEGTVKVIETLEQRNEKITWALIGEPSSHARLCDVVKNGRRGSLNGRLTVRGVQGHVAYPHLAKNPVHLALHALADLVATEWDSGNSSFPPTTFQVSNVQAGTGATNVIPGTFEIAFNFRYSTETDHVTLQQRVHQVLDAADLDYDIVWDHSGSPFLTSGGELVTAAQAAIQTELGYRTELSTAGGTSDGRFISPTGAQVLEVGPLNATIHKVNECVSIRDLDALSSIYERILEQLLT